MARFPSVKQLVKESGETFARFPFALVAAIAGTIVGLTLSYLRYGDSDNEKSLQCLLMVCSLGLTLFFSITLFSERKQIAKQKSFWLYVGAIIVLAAYYIYLRSYFVQVEFIRYALINIALHLLASFAAFTDRNNITGFWQFNKALFLRLFFGGIYSLTLYLGLCLALAAIDQLFNVKIDGRYYFRIWIIVVGIFNTWFFLAGVPKDLEGLNSSNEYPKGLKIFTQYVLLPLVTLYLLILYAYMGKIIIVQSLPKGWVSYLVLGFSVIGILALLLIYPIRNNEGNNWIHIFSKWFYGALYPLVIMLFIAIGRRISDYGITENRYFIIVLAIWLAIMSTYFLFGKTQNIKLIPTTLCIIALLTCFGPWGAFSVSERSQVGRLEKLLVDNGVMKDGKVVTKHAEVADSVADRITSIIGYLDQMHGFDKIKSWFSGNIYSLTNDSLRWTRVGNVMKLLNVQETYAYDHYRGEDGEIYRNFSFYPEYNNLAARDISGYDYEIMFNASTYEGAYYNKYTIGADTLFFKLTSDSMKLEISYNHKLLQSMDMNQFYNELSDSCKKQKNYNSTVAPPCLEKVLEDSTLRIKLQFTNLYGYVRKRVYKTTNASGNFLLKRKEKEARN